jgi:hypothetical protein
MKRVVKKITVVKRSDPGIGKSVWENKMQYERKCGTKTQYFTEKSCRASMEQFVEQHEETPMSTYKCPFCGWWHFGHVIGTERLKQGEKNEEVNESENNGVGSPN